MADNTPDIIIALASFVSEQDPWTLPEIHTRATILLKTQFTSLRTDPDSSIAFWATIEDILKQKVRPLFAKTKNPAITASGRKNFHPVPLPRFDASVLDPETKPWKNQDVYATTVLSWIVSQYQVRPHPQASLIQMTNKSTGHRPRPPRSALPSSRPGHLNTDRR